MEHVPLLQDRLMPAKPWGVFEQESTGKRSGIDLEDARSQEAMDLSVRQDLMKLDAVVLKIRVLGSSRWPCPKHKFQNLHLI